MDVTTWMDVKKGDMVRISTRDGSVTGRIISEQPGCGCGYWVVKVKDGWTWTVAKTSVQPVIVAN